MTPDINEMCIHINSTLKEALHVIDHNAQGICFVHNENHKFSGVITDGDIRRVLLEGKPLNTSIQDVVNKSALSLPLTSSAEVIRNSLTKMIRHIPLLNEFGSSTIVHCLNLNRRISAAARSSGGGASFQ